MNDLLRVPRSFVEYWLVFVRFGVRSRARWSAHPLSVIITGGSGTGSELAALSSINSLPANPIVEKAPLFTGFKTTNLNGRDEGA